MNESEAEHQRSELTPEGRLSIAQVAAVKMSGGSLIRMKDLAFRARRLEDGSYTLMIQPADEQGQADGSPEVTFALKADGSYPSELAPREDELDELMSLLGRKTGFFKKSVPVRPTDLPTEARVPRELSDRMGMDMVNATTLRMPRRGPRGTY